MSIIALDFDGTCTTHAYPYIGEELPGCISTLKLLQAQGHKIMLWTMRADEELVQAVEWLEARGVKCWSVNKNPEQHTWTKSVTKQYAHTFIDDAALGCPLIHNEGERAYVDWPKVKQLLKDQGFIPMQAD